MNSRSLSVTIVQPRATAWAAINRSLPPIGVPAFSRRLRMRLVQPHLPAPRTESTSRTSSTFQAGPVSVADPFFAGTVAQLSGDDDAVQTCASPNRANVLCGSPLRMTNQIGNDIGIEQITHHRSTASGNGSAISGKIVVQRWQRRQQVQAGYWAAPAR